MLCRVAFLLLLDGYYIFKVTFVENTLLSFALLLGCLFYFGVVLKSFEALRYFVQNQNALSDSITEILDIHIPMKTELHILEQTKLHLVSL